MAARGGPEKPRIAVVAPGDVTDPGNWSGSPAGLFAGLAEAGAEPLAISASPPASRRVYGRLGISWTDEASNPLLRALAGGWARLGLRRAGRVDGVVTIGSGYDVRTGAPRVSFDDMTFAQGARQPWSPVSSLSGARARRWLEGQRAIFRAGRGCCVGSEWAARSVREDYGIDPARVHIVGFGRNLDGSPPAASRDWSVPRFIFVGVEWERKRGPAVLESFRVVRERFPAATLTVVGEHPTLDEPGVSGQGRLSLRSPGDRGRLEGLLAEATCLVLPSSFEAFGIAYVDAGATGVPSIGTTVGGAPDAVGDGGILVDPEDREALTAAMLEMCDPETARDLGDRARARSELFTWRAVAERVLRALRPAGVDLGSLAPFLEPAPFYSSSDRSLRRPR